MIQFNSDHIIVGQIKQLLANFNLPQYRVYTRANANYYKKYHVECNEIIESVPLNKDAPIPNNVRYIDYIKDGGIKRYYDNKWHSTGRVYSYNAKEINHVRNLKIQNNIYDSYTHEYLGDYLRFQRDYNNINLMPFYNCFSNRLATNLNYSFKLDQTEDTTPQEQIVEFNSDDVKYKIFMLPVKMFKEYTIAIDCDGGVEICCGIYGKYQDTREKLSTLPIKTYTKFATTSFTSPFIYSKLVDAPELGSESLTEIANIEQDLKMFIKIPADNNSTIVVLEGNYLNWNDRFIGNSAFNLFKNGVILEETDNKVYKQCEYLQNDPNGELYIDLGTTVKKNYSFEIKYKFNTPDQGSAQIICGKRVPWFSIAQYQEKFNISNTVDYNLEKINNIKNQDTNSHVLKVLNGHLYFDDANCGELALGDMYNDHTASLFLFGRRNEDGNLESSITAKEGTVYYVKIWNDQNRLVNYFVPAVEITSGDNPTNVYGMYDIVATENQFHTNANTTTTADFTGPIIEAKVIENTSTNFNQTNIKRNHTINNFEEDIEHEDIEDRNLSTITALQLLSLNTTFQYPFSDKLIEFLTDNMITPIDQISDNIKRAQTIMAENKNDISIDGLWSQKMQLILYNFLNQPYSRNHLITSDKLDATGFIDKNIEVSYDSIKYDSDGKPHTINTLKDINLYENAFRNTYKGGKK